MGTIAGEPRQGLIYLHQNTSKQFTDSLSKTDHKTADTFLNELIDVFVKSNDNTQALQVSLELACRFQAVLQGTEFKTCNDLMSHLLSLYSQSQTVNSKNTPDIPQERSSNRKRKSLPRRNIKPAVFNGEDSDIVLDTVTEDEWKEKSASSEDIGPTDDDDERNAAFDLSVVKEEQPEEMESEGTEKGKDEDQRGMSLKLQKTPSTRDAHSLDTLYLRKMQSQMRMMHRPIHKENIEPRMNLNKNSLKPKIPTYQPPRTSNESVMNTAHRYSIMNHLSEVDKKPVDTLDRSATDDSYTYVLNSLDSPALDNNQQNSLPASPMHVPLKYPKSSPYAASSDDDKPQDLSNTNEQPHNLSLAKSESKTAKTEHVIKYDKNGNALPELLPLTVSSNSRFPTPSNLIFNDLPTMNNGLIGEPQLISQPSHDGKPPPKNIKMMNNGLISPTQMVAYPQDGNKMFDNQSGKKPIAMTPVGPVRFQVVVPPNQQVSQQLIMANPMMSPTVSFPTGLPLLMAVSPPEQVVAQSQRISQVDPSDPNADNSMSESAMLMELKKKRKKMDDTTCFRDPPETSLPFNGPNKYRFYCDVCDTGFTRRYTFNRHKCKGRVEKHYCQLCDKAYLSKYKLKDHILVKHEGQTVSCPDCGKKFSSRSSMEMHKKQQHEGQFSIWCKICGKGFNHTGHYYGHMNKHTNTKPFWCQQCGKRFFGSSYLHNHKQVCRGNNDLNYNCTLCDRKFKCELYLKKHMKVHEANPILGDPETVAMEEDNDGPVELTLSKPNETSEGEPADTPAYSSTGGAVFPNGPDSFDSSSNSGMLVIDEAKAGVDNEEKTGAMLEASSEEKT